MLFFVSTGVYVQLYPAAAEPRRRIFSNPMQVSFSRHYYPEPRMRLTVRDVPKGALRTHSA